MRGGYDSVPRPLGSRLGRSWVLLGASWAGFLAQRGAQRFGLCSVEGNVEDFWPLLGRSWAVLGPLGPSWEPLGRFFSQRGAQCFGLRYVEGNVEDFWLLLGRSWSVLGPRGLIIVIVLINLIILIILVNLIIMIILTILIDWALRAAGGLLSVEHGHSPKV